MKTVKLEITDAFLKDIIGMPEDWSIAKIEVDNFAGILTLVVTGAEESIPCPDGGQLDPVYRMPDEENRDGHPFPLSVSWREHNSETLTFFSVAGTPTCFWCGRSSSEHGALLSASLYNGVRT